MSTTTPRDLISALIKTTNVVLSPDATQVVFGVQRVDLEANTYRSQLWTAPVDGSAPSRPLTAGDKGDASPVWSPDGRFLAFTSKRADDTPRSTVHVLPMAGPGEVTTIATMRGSVEGLTWSPDGRWLAFTTRTHDARYDEPDLAKQPPRRIERFLSKLNGDGWIHDRPNHIYLVPADGTGKPTNLTPGEFMFSQPAWMADSSALIASGRGHETWDRDLAEDLYRISLTGERKALTAGTGRYSSPRVSPDGTLVAFIGHDDPSTDPQNAMVGVLDLATCERRWVTNTFDRTFDPTVGSSGPQWDGASLYAVAEDRGDARVYRVSLAGDTPTAVSPAGACVSAFDVQRGVAVVSLATAQCPAEVYGGPIGGELRRLSMVTDRFTITTAPIAYEHFLAPSTDGVEVDAWIVRPRDFDPTRRYPVLINVHGGPFTQYGRTYFDEVQMQANAGYIVLLGNPRGGSGRDNAWGQAIAGPKHPAIPGRGWGSVDVEDVLAILDEGLRREPAADRARVGMLGGSYGGYMASWLAGHHGERFAAICSERAVNNLASLEWNSDIATFFRNELGPTHLDDPEEYRRMSPIAYVRDIHTPMLLLHSEDDLRCPITQAEELFVALRLLGREVEFVRFPAESHELSRSGSPIHRIQRADLILEFFAKYLHPET